MAISEGQQNSRDAAQLECILLHLRGTDNKEISKRLGVSATTVKRYLGAVEKDSRRLNSVQHEQMQRDRYEILLKDAQKIIETENKQNVNKQTNANSSKLKMPSILKSALSKARNLSAPYKVPSRLERGKNPNLKTSSAPRLPSKENEPAESDIEDNWIVLDTTPPPIPKRSSKIQTLGRSRTRFAAEEAAEMESKLFQVRAKSGEEARKRKEREKQRATQLNTSQTSDRSGLSTRTNTTLASLASGFGKRAREKLSQSTLSSASKRSKTTAQSASSGKFLGVFIEQTRTAIFPPNQARREAARVKQREAISESRKSTEPAIQETLNTSKHLLNSMATRSREVVETPKAKTPQIKLHSPPKTPIAKTPQTKTPKESTSRPKTLKSLSSHTKSGIGNTPSPKGSVVSITGSVDSPTLPEPSSANAPRQQSIDLHDSEEIAKIEALQTPVNALDSETRNKLVQISDSLPQIPFPLHNALDTPTKKGSPNIWKNIDGIEGSDMDMSHVYVSSDELMQESDDYEESVQVSQLLTASGNLEDVIVEAPSVAEDDLLGVTEVDEQKEEVSGVTQIQTTLIAGDAKNEDFIMKESKGQHTSGEIEMPSTTMAPLAEAVFQGLSSPVSLPTESMLEDVTTSLSLFSEKMLEEMPTRAVKTTVEEETIESITKADVPVSIDVVLEEITTTEVVEN